MGISIQHVTRIQIQHVTMIQIQHVTRIQIQPVMKIRILHVKRIDLVQGRATGKEDGGAKVDKDACVLKEKDTQGINYGSSNMASDFSSPQSHAINDGSSVTRNSVIDGVSESSLRVTIYYNLLCIRVCAFYK